MSLRAASEFTFILKLDHITVIAPTLDEGVSHVLNCLGLAVQFGTHHDYMGTHNHRLNLGNKIYLEIVALDPAGIKPARPRWFGLDNQDKVKSDWSQGRRLRGWVANTRDIDSVISSHPSIFGEKIPLPTIVPTFDFSIPADGSLPLDGAAPSMIDHRGDLAFLDTIPDLGARLHSIALEHPNPIAIGKMYRELEIIDPPAIKLGSKVSYSARIETPTGLKELW